MKNPEKWIETIIKRYINESSENTLYKEKNEKTFAEPLVGFSSGNDPLFLFYKEDIGDFYLTPLDIFKKSFPKLKTASNQLSIISWILPQTEATKSDNRKQTFYPSERWARARIYGEEVNDKLRRHVVKKLQEIDIVAVAPIFSSLWKSGKISKQYGKSSTWSERHAAYAAGLGTFGLCDGLITPKGKAMRCGSVIAKIVIPATPRTYSNHNSYCLFYSKGTCGICIQRCPAGAITEKGHDKLKCSEHSKIAREYVEKTYGFKGYGCGLCQTKVPCESKIPTKIESK